MGDERSVPLLMEQTRTKRSLSSIEILGRQKVKAAIPFFEEILRTSEMYSPEMRAALSAMSDIRGKKASIWDYRSKDGKSLEQHKENAK